jgi:hydrocephalus-inducing protein
LITNTVILSLPIAVTAETAYSHFIIEPPKGVDFGVVPVTATSTRTFSIKNTGIFPFEYDITPRPDAPEVAARGRGRGHGRGSSPPPPRRKSAKGPGIPLSVPPFTLCSAIGTILPGQMVNISVDVHSPTAGTFTSHVFIKVTDSEVQDGINFTLAANVMSPGIYNVDSERIFRGQNLLLRSDVQKNNVNAFLEDEHTFHFAPLLLGQSAQAAVTLFNPLPITCTIDISVKPRGKSNGQNFPFDVSDKVVVLEQNCTKEIVLIFAPQICANFLGAFEAAVSGGIAPENKALKFLVEGAGTLPSVTLVSATGRPKTSSYSLLLGRVLLNDSREKTIAIRNDSFIPARIKLSTRPNPDFVLKDSERFDSEIVLAADRILNIGVVFSPLMVHRSVLDVSISVLDNPKADITLSFAGDGFMEDVIFEGETEDDNHVFFRDNVVGRQNQATFLIRNVSQSDIRFQFALHHDFQFFPKVGHLRAGSSKQVQITFFTDKPVRYPSIRINCTWTKIEFEDPAAPDWDESHKTFEYSGPSQKVVKLMPEPVCRPIGPEPRDIILRVAAVSDVIRFSIDTTEIPFAPTMMYQTRVYEVRVQNTSQIRFDYQWQLKKLTTAYRPDAPCPFSVESTRASSPPVRRLFSDSNSRPMRSTISSRISN